MKKREYMKGTPESYDPNRSYGIMIKYGDRSKELQEYLTTLQ